MAHFITKKKKKKWKVSMTSRHYQIRHTILWIVALLYQTIAISFPSCIFSFYLYKMPFLIPVYYLISLKSQPVFPQVYNGVWQITYTFSDTGSCICREPSSCWWKKTKSLDSIFQIMPLCLLLLPSDMEHRRARLPWHNKVAGSSSRASDNINFKCF